MPMSSTLAGLTFEDVGHHVQNKNNKFLKEKEGKTEAVHLMVPPSNDGIRRGSILSGMSIGFSEGH